MPLAAHRVKYWVICVGEVTVVPGGGATLMDYSLSHCLLALWRI